MGFFQNIFSFGRRNETTRAAGDLYQACVAQTRKPDFYDSFEVPDTVDGRFDLLALHIFMVLYRLKGGDRNHRVLSERLIKAMFRDLDINLREMGAGDMGVAPRMKKMVAAFYGRRAAYDDAVKAHDPQALQEALRRNLYRQKKVKTGSISAMADYVNRSISALGSVSDDALLRGQVGFPPPETNRANPTAA